MIPTFQCPTLFAVCTQISFWSLRKNVCVCVCVCNGPWLTHCLLGRCGATWEESKVKVFSQTAASLPPLWVPWLRHPRSVSPQSSTRLQTATVSPRMAAKPRGPDYFLPSPPLFPCLLSSLCFWLLFLAALASISLSACLCLVLFLRHSLEVLQCSLSPSSPLLPPLYVCVTVFFFCCAEVAAEYEGFAGSTAAV